jgi:hypothetical protein
VTVVEIGISQVIITESFPPNVITSQNGQFAMTCKIKSLVPFSAVRLSAYGDDNMDSVIVNPRTCKLGKSEVAEIAIRGRLRIRAKVGTITFRMQWEDDYDNQQSFTERLVTVERPRRN